MIKAYLKDGVITLFSKDRKKAEFTAGTALTTIGEKREESNPYTLFDDYDEASFPAFVRAELDRLYKLGIDVPAVLISALDKDRTDKLYTNREQKVMLETVSGEAVLVFSLESAFDLLALELVSAVNRRKPLKKCEYCGGYFFPAGRSDALYCGRVGSDGFSCKKIGANRQYRKQNQSDSVKKQYDKITKHYRYLKNKGDLPEADFARWMDEASSLYTRFQRGEISENALIQWLSDGVAIENQPARRNEISDYLL